MSPRQRAHRRRAKDRRRSVRRRRHRREVQRVARTLRDLLGFAEAAR